MAEQDQLHELASAVLVLAGLFEELATQLARDPQASNMLRSKAGTLVVGAQHAGALARDVVEQAAP